MKCRGDQRPRQYDVWEYKPAEAQNDGFRTPIGWNGESLLPFSQTLTVMAVPGADRRKSTHRRRTGRAKWSVHNRRQCSCVPVASDRTSQQPVGRVGAPGTGPSVGDAGKRNVRILNQTAETGDRSAPEPPAIEGVREWAVVAGRSGADDEWTPSVRSRARRKRYLFAPSGIASGRPSAFGHRTTGTRHSNRATAVAIPRVRIRIPTVITK